MPKIVTFHIARVHLLQTGYPSQKIIWRTQIYTLALKEKSSYYCWNQIGTSLNDQAITSGSFGFKGKANLHLQQKNIVKKFSYNKRAFPFSLNHFSSEFNFNPTRTKKNQNTKHEFQSDLPPRQKKTIKISKSWPSRSYFHNCECKVCQSHQE